MDPREIAFRLGTALLFGAIIGFERQWRQRMAGLRTNALVSVGAAGFVVFSMTVLPIAVQRASPRRSFPGSASSALA
jgi:uncharacterized membrane protein YhiD involved in acid resistance